MHIPTAQECDATMLNRSYFPLYHKNRLGAGVPWLCTKAAIYHQDKTDVEKRKHFLLLFFQVFIPYLTNKGKKIYLPLLN